LEAERTSGTGGVGSLPPSRLSRILQEKAESLKRQRSTAEAAVADVNRRLDALQKLGIKLEETEAKQATLREQVRHSDWELAEASAKALLTYLETDGAPKIDERLLAIDERIARVAQLGIALPNDPAPLMVEARTDRANGGWTEVLRRVETVEGWLKAAEDEYGRGVEAKLGSILTWAPEPEDRVLAAKAATKTLLSTQLQGASGESLDEQFRLVARELPAAAERRSKVRGSAAGLSHVAADFAVSTQSLEQALAADDAAILWEMPASVDRVDAAVQKLATEIQGRAVAGFENYRVLLQTLREDGIDPEPLLASLEDLAARVPSAPAEGLAELLEQARRLVEEPVVTVVAGLLDEVRPKLVEARRLGRDSSEVLGAMNRSREALRLRIYGEALAAAHEALQRVVRLTEDLEAAREELASLRDLVARLEPAGFSSEPFAPALAELGILLDRLELDRAQEKLRELVQRIGIEAISAFQSQLNELSLLGQQGIELGFAPPNFERHLGDARVLLEGGTLGDAAEGLSRLKVELRTAAQPYVARRLEEIALSLDELADPSAIEPVRRLLADVDVSLRVKEDLRLSLDTLRRAEREFSVVFAQNASLMVEGLEEECRILDTMGGPGDQLQRLVDEVQQIFNMGDFVKAFHAAQEVRQRAHQLQLDRNEEALSHAKLAIVELGQMGLDTAPLHTELEAAQLASQDARYPDSYQGALRVQERARRVKSSAQGLFDRIAEAADRWQSLLEVSGEVQGLAGEISEARAKVEALDFDAANALVAKLDAELERELARVETGRIVVEIDQLLADCRRMSVPVDERDPRIEAIREGNATNPSRENLSQARAFEEEIIQKLRPVLEENLRGLESDVEIARTADIEVAEIVELLVGIRRGVAEPVPLKVAEILDTTRGRFLESKGFLEHAERVLKRASEALDRAEVARVDVRPFRERLTRAERHRRERDYVRVIEQAGTLERELVQATRHQVSKTLASFQGSLLRARAANAETTLAENLLDKARQALEAGEPLEALRLAANSESELERVELQLHMAHASLETIGHRYAQAERTGLVAPSAASELAEAKAAFEGRRYADVLDRALRVADELAEASGHQRKAHEAIEGAERQVREASEFNAELTDVLPMLEEARTRARAGEYELAIRRGREATDGARWAIERLFAGPLAELEELFGLVRTFGETPEIDQVRSARDEAESSVKIREWRRATESLDTGRDHANRALDRAVERALRALEGTYTILGAAGGPELEVRRGTASRIAADRGNRNFRAALEAIKNEEARAREHIRLELATRVAALQDRLWIGERVGVDTTPVMELFSEAKLAMEAGRLGPVPSLVDRGTASLDTLVRKGVEEKVGVIETELVFARDGLHVTLGTVLPRYEEAKAALAAGRPVDSARALLDAEEELNKRKSLHRELMNLHFLVDAALARAVERRLDVNRPRQLFEESVRALVQDYAPALEKAREALRLLQEMLQGSPEPTPAAFVDG
jgi:hypothetical protein